MPQTSFGKKSIIRSLMNANSETKGSLKQCYGGFHSNTMNPFEKLLWKMKDLTNKLKNK